jgi:hypothetical protein
MIGDALLIDLLPYAKNQTWEAKTFAKTCLTFTVISSSLSHVSINDVFRGRTPAQWYKSPDTINLKLRQHQAHIYLGHAGCIWQYHKTPEECDPIMTSDEEGELELRSWLEDAIHPAERGELLARCPLEKVWDHPPFLPLLDTIPLKDRLFPSFIYSPKTGREPVRRSYAPGDRLTIPLMSLIDEQSREAMFRRTSESANLEMGKQAQRLLTEWERSVNRPEINKLLTRMIIGRLATGSIDALAGITALIHRLRAHGYGDAYKGSQYQQMTPEPYDSLLNETLEFTRTFLPRAFLRDLVLSEILISWYWRKNLISTKPS